MSITDINCPQWRKLNSYNIIKTVEAKYYKSRDMVGQLKLGVFRSNKKRLNCFMIIIY